MKNSIIVCLLGIVFNLTSFEVKSQAWQWATMAGGVNNDAVYCIAADNSGNSYVAGRFFDSISFDSVSLSNSNKWNVYIAEYDMNGNILWAKIAASDSLITVNGLCLGSSGNISIVGQYSGTAHFGDVSTVSLSSSGDNDVFVADYDSTGVLVWAKSLGGLGIDYAGGISTDRSGNLFVTGDFHITAFPYSSSKIFIAKFDSTGNNAWLRQEINFGNNHFGNGIKTDKSGNSYLTGEFFNTLIFDSTIILDAGNIESNIFILKFDSAGKLLWSQKAGASSGYCGGKVISIDGIGNSYISGYYHGTISFDSISISSTSGLNYDIFIARCDSQGIYSWVNKSLGAGNVTGIDVDNNGNAFICGTFLQTISFNSNSLSSHGDNDVFIAKADLSGNFVWASSYGSLQNEEVTGIEVNGDNIILAGNFTDTIQFSSSILLSNNGSSLSDIYLASLGLPTGIIEEGINTRKVTCFPNPATNEIQLLGISGNEKYILCDDIGRVILTGSLKNTNRISIDNLRSGVYFLQLFSQIGNSNLKPIFVVKN